MAFDGLITRAVEKELERNLINSRVEKIYMPNKNELLFNFHTTNNKLKLLISIDASLARFHFTNETKENPVKAPQFCMVLRKYIQGAKLIKINQFGLDRVVCLEFENRNELGDLNSYKLYIELMGKYSNIILVNPGNKIIDSIRHVDFTMSSVREVLPNKDYILPSTLDKNEFLYMDYPQFIANLKVASMDPSFSIENMSKLIANQFVGFSKTFIENLFVFCNIKDKFTEENTKKLYETIQITLNNCNENLINLNFINNDYTIDFNNFSSNKSNIQVSNFLDSFYSTKEKNQKIKTSKFNLQRDVLNFRCKYEKNLKRVNDIFEEAYDMNKYKLYGELISANIYRISQGTKEIQIENYYDNNNLIKIPLKPNYSPAKNAQIYFKKYTKLKNAISYANIQKEEYEKNIDYLQNVLYLISEATSLNELNEIKSELIEAGYLKPSKSQKKYHDNIALPPFEYTFEGVTILAGRNNLQNDKLTFKLSRKNETWLHVKDFHGSHVIIKSDSVTDSLLEHAAKIAVLHSEVKNSNKISVDYTLVKFVHKPNGAKPGKVIYTNYKTIIV